MRKVLLALLIPLVCVAPVAPAEIVVEGGCTLPDAITAANTDSAVGSCSAGSGTDSIVLTDNVVLTSADNGVNGLPKITSSIIIEGNRLRISRGDEAPAFRIFEVEGALTLKNTTVSNGSCDGCPGGAIESRGGFVEVVDSNITQNSALYGGGLRVSGATTILRNSTVSKNSSALQGAGIDQFYGTLTITDSTITRNYGNGVDVAFYSFQGTTIVNSTISDNSGLGIEMGVYSSGGTLSNSTVVGNSISVYPGAMTIADSIVTGGSCFGTGNGGGNFDDDGSCGGQTITGLDPVLRKNGGPTRTHALLAGSSAIDAVADCTVDTDQRGFGRGASCDSGAFEFGAFQFDVRADCPGGGQVRVRASALEPGALLDIYQGPDEGTSQVIGGACDGTELGITDPVLLGQIEVAANGRARANFELAAEDCGQYLEAVESTICATSGAKEIGVECAGGNRYEDQFDGTVLDCSTDLLWLKDASCDDLPQGATWFDATDGAAVLADGTCSLTDGSSAGDWRLPTAEELCSAFTGQAEFPCPAFAGTDSLIDSSVGPPTVVNGSGDDVWTEGDVFFGVESQIYWSSGEAGASAWVGDLGTGDLTSRFRDRLLLMWPVRSR